VTIAPAESVRCSAWAHSVGLDPIGSAGSYRGFLLVEVPLPWPRDIGDIPAVAAVRGLLDSLGMRVQALVPTGTSLRAVAYLSPIGEHFAGFVRREAAYGSDVAGTVTSLVSPFSDPGEESHDGRRDVLVCTHGRRDVCCGSLGTGLAAQLDPAALPDGVRPWRTSHTGGHRFAPTFIVLPEATAWAYADADLIDRVLRRRGDTTEVVDRYRGCAGLGAPAVQALEREVLRRVGWGLLDHPRSGSTEPRGHTHLIVEQPGGQCEVWEGYVEPGRRMPVPDCGKPVAEARKFETEWVVRDVRLL
jgi:hypothetical protein